MSIMKYDIDTLQGCEIFVSKKHDSKYSPTHRHDYYEMIMFRGFNGFCIFNGVRYEIKNNCIFFLTPTDFHRIEGDEGTSGYSVNASFSEKIIDGIILKSELLKPCVVYEPSLYLIETFEHLSEIFSPDITDKLQKSEEEHHLALLIYMMLREGEPVESKALCVNPNIRSAMSYILTDISKTYTLTEIAHKSGFSPSHFSYLFHKEIGMGFKKWLDGIRIDHAKRLLESGDMKVLEVSMECGFGTPSHFIRAFREAVGQTPTEYRKSKNEEL